MRGLKTMTGLRVIIAGHAFMQNLRRGHYELAVDDPPRPAGRRRVHRTRQGDLTGGSNHSPIQHALPSNNAIEPASEGGLSEALQYLLCKEASMSEQGWREFLAAEGVDDWVVLHGGATAVFRVPSLGEAAQLAQAVAQVPGLEGSGTLLTIADGRLSVRLTRGVFRLEERHIDLARAVSAVARAHGAVADRTGAQEVQLAIAAKPDAVDVGFWRAVLGYTGLADDNAIDPLGHGSTVWMQELDAAKPLRHAMHVDVSVAREHVEARLAAALAAGGRIVDDADAPAAWILADRAGNRVCIAAWPDGSVPPIPG